MQWYRGLVGSNGARGLGRLSRSGWTLLTVKLSLVCSVGSNIVGAFRRPAPHCPVTIDRVRHHAALALAALRETPRPPASAPGSATRPPYHPPSIIYVAHAKVYRMMKAEMTRLGASGAELQAVLHHATVDVNAIVAMNPSGWAYDPVPNSTIMPFGRNDNEAAQMLSHKRSGRNPPPSHNARLDKGRQTQLLKRWNGRSVAPDSNFFLAQKYQTKQAPLPHNKALMEFWTKHAVLIHLGPQVASELQHHVLHHNANPWWRAPQYAGVLVTLAGANLASVRNAHYGRPAGARPVRPKDREPSRAPLSARHGLRHWRLERLSARPSIWSSRRNGRRCDARRDSGSDGGRAPKRTALASLSTNVAKKRSSGIGSITLQRTRRTSRPGRYTPTSPPTRSTGTRGGTSSTTPNA